MISPATISLRCDGTDRLTNDICNSSVVITVPLEEIAGADAWSTPLNRTLLLIIRTPGWSVSQDGKHYCPNCRPKPAK